MAVEAALRWCLVLLLPVCCAFRLPGRRNCLGSVQPQESGGLLSGMDVVIGTLCFLFFFCFFCLCVAEGGEQVIDGES